MKKTFKSFLVLSVATFLMMGTTLTARAEVEEGAIIKAAAIAPLMKWVAGATGIAVPNQPQVIASQNRLSQVTAANYAHQGRIQAAYIPGTVFLNHLHWDIEDATQVSLLVHELVHHAQLFANNRQWPCQAAKEAQAYHLQNLWLEQHGHQPFVSESRIKRISQCSEN